MLRAYRLELNDEDLEWVTLEGGVEQRFAKEPNTSWWIRFVTGLMSIFVLESQL